MLASSGRWWLRGGGSIFTFPLPATLLIYVGTRNDYRNLDIANIQFLEDAGYNVEVDESLAQKLNDMEPEDKADDPDYHPADQRVT
ncbi:unnamed protein product [Rangifer tarandus platyrhynchus]|uniref:Uncharacterized protein n=1 Tax=Rangifer tarandus platyrhynchus TaxID=3082113 RepID=A0ABN8Z3J6_RANTA|nr:unnamed protein product [Rangifer tarandus platyrhynchus]